MGAMYAPELYTGNYLLYHTAALVMLLHYSNLFLPFGFGSILRLWLHHLFQ